MAKSEKVWTEKKKHEMPVVRLLLRLPVTRLRLGRPNPNLCDMKKLFFIPTSPFRLARDGCEAEQER